MPSKPKAQIVHPTSLPPVPKAPTPKKKAKPKEKSIKRAGRETAKPTYTVIRDTREKNGEGWVFGETSTCLGTVSETMHTGDYTLSGLESIITVERKGSVKEFAGNLTQPRFERELERMATFKYAYVILEFELSDIMSWPVGCGLPPYKWRCIRTSKYFLLSRFWELQMKYPYVRFLFVGKHGKEAVSSLFKRIAEQYGKNRKSSS